MKRPFFRRSDLEDEAWLLRVRAVEAGVEDRPVIELQDVVDFALDGYRLCLDQPLATNVDGCTSFHDRKILVASRVERFPGRKRFTIAHEIGHVVLHTAYVLSLYPPDQGPLFDLPSSTALQDRSLEWQANAFAGAFLVPRQSLLDAYERHGEWFLDPQVVGDHFGVSWGCARVRLEESGLRTPSPPGVRLL